MKIRSVFQNINSSPAVVKKLLDITSIFGRKMVMDPIQNPVD